MQNDMNNDLKALVEELVGSADAGVPPAPLPEPEVIESDSEEAWNDFQDSQQAYARTFQQTGPAPL